MPVSDFLSSTPQPRQASYRRVKQHQNDTDVQYNETCLRRPRKGPSKCGLCYQVVSLSGVN